MAYLLRVGKLEPTLDPGQPAIEIIKPNLHCGEIHLERSHIALDRAHPDGDLVKPGVDPVEPFIKDTGEPTAQEIEDLGILFGHSGIVARQTLWCERGEKDAELAPEAACQPAHPVQPHPNRK